MIQGGHYSISRGTGLTPGRYHVRIYWAEPIPLQYVTATVDGAVMPPADIPEAKELIPAKYNTLSELTVEVRQRHPNVFDFSLDSVPPTHP